MRQFVRLPVAWAVLGGGAALGALSCQSGERILGGDPRVCTAEVRPAIVATVKDATTGAFIASGATMKVAVASLIDSVMVPASRPDLDAARLVVPSTNEFPGTYSVWISRPGYITHIVVGLPVTSDGCHVQTRELNVGLQTSFAPPTP